MFIWSIFNLNFHYIWLWSSGTFIFLPRFLRLLVEKVCLPAYCLVDCDPYGFDILTTYRFGSMVTWVDVYLSIGILLRINLYMPAGILYFSLLLGCTFLLLFLFFSLNDMSAGGLFWNLKEKSYVVSGQPNLNSNWVYRFRSGYAIFSFRLNYNAYPSLRNTIFYIEKLKPSSRFLDFSPYI